MNTRNIQPIAFWSPSGTDEADQIQLYNFHGYDFNGLDSYVSYRMMSSADKHVIYEGTVKVPASVVDQWGADDQPIFDFVLTELGLTSI